MGDFWQQRQAINARSAIFHQWEQLEKSGCIQNFRLLVGQGQGFRQGWFFADSDAHKWLDAAARVYALHPAAELKELMDDYIALLAAVQEADGYLFTYNQYHFPGVCWTNLQIEHELYCHGHLIEAGVSHFEATGEEKMLAIARKAADLLVRRFLNGSPLETPGHEEVEIALLRLYQLTGEVAYLDLAEQLIERRGQVRFFAWHILRQNRSMATRRRQVARQLAAYQRDHPGEVGPSNLPTGNLAKKPPFSGQRWQLSALSGRYFQQHAPVRQQTVPVGHAVRFGYLQTAIAMLYRARGDATLLPALRQAWKHMVERRMYLTGGLGALPDLEGFGRDDELPDESAYAETCAALAGMFWNWEMSQIDHDACYSDLFEWQLYNAAGVGMGVDGTTYLYNNPLASRGGITRQPWYRVPCCPANLTRTFAGLGKYRYSSCPGDLWVHQYISGAAEIHPGALVRLKLDSGLPWDGTVKLTLDLDAPFEFNLHLRIPSWCPAFLLRLNGEKFPVNIPDRPSREPTSGGYDPRKAWFLTIRRNWSPSDCLELHLEMPIIVRKAHPRVRNYWNRVALTRGPLVYCLESLDNPGLDLFTTRILTTGLQTQFAPELFNGTWLIQGLTIDGKGFTAIPYFLWANRGESQMKVWVGEANKGLDGV
jgi:hypothetical protein